MDWFARHGAVHFYHIAVPLCSGCSADLGVYKGTNTFVHFYTGSFSGMCAFNELSSVTHILPSNLLNDLTVDIKLRCFIFKWHS